MKHSDYQLDVSELQAARVMPVLTFISPWEWLRWRPIWGASASLALLFAGCITTRNGPHDTPVIDGVVRDGGAE